LSVEILNNTPLTPFNTLALAPLASAFCVAETNLDLEQAVGYALRHSLDLIILGGGSNIVINNNINGLVVVVQTQGVAVVARGVDNVVIRVAAGENWHSLVKTCLINGWYGIENLALIPGSVGAAPIQNIGAYGVELSDLLESVTALDLSTKQYQKLTAEQCKLGYRDSIFKHDLRGRVVITEVMLKLSTRPRVSLTYPALADALASVPEPTPEDVFRAVCDIRSSKLPDPAQIPNVGSFFKNPVLSADEADALIRRYPDIPRYPQANGDVKFPAAWLIDQAGWKGHRRGPVGVHGRQALVLVNYGGATGEQILALADDIAGDIARRFDIDLEIEPVILGAHRP
jgi:UDP-N-acetylmuramate dehydrogenase